MLLTPLLLVAADRWWIPLPRRPGAARRRRGAERAAERAGDHRRLRPLRPDRRPDAVRQRHRRRRCSTTTPRRSRRCAGSAGACYYGDATRLDLMRTAGADTRAGARARDRRHRAERRRAPGWCARTSRRLTDRRPGAQRPALLRAARARRDADRARDARLGADERRAARSSCSAGSRTRRATWRCAFVATTSPSCWRWRRTARTRPG